MPYYPILIDLQGKKVIVVGGGAVAQRKIETLREYGANVHVIAGEMTPTLSRYVKKGEIRFLGKEFRKDYLDGAFVVIAATDDHILNCRISEQAREKGILINTVDQPSECNFIVPSVLRRGDLLIAVSTSGKSPALAKKIREDLEKEFGREYESLLILMGRMRKEILSRRLSQDENRRIFQDLVDSDVLKAISRKEWNEVATILNKTVSTQLSSEDVINYLEVE